MLCLFGNTAKLHASFAPFAPLREPGLSSMGLSGPVFLRQLFPAEHAEHALGERL
jgi:hypothetical protein